MFLNKHSLTQMFFHLAKLKGKVKELQALSTYTWLSPSFKLLKFYVNYFVLLVAEF